MGYVGDQFHLHPLTAGLLLKSRLHACLDVVEGLRHILEIRILRKFQGLGQVPRPDRLHLIRQKAEIPGQAAVPAEEADRTPNRRKQREHRQRPEKPGRRTGDEGAPYQGVQHLAHGEKHRNRQQYRAPVQPLFHRAFQPAGPEKTPKAPAFRFGVVPVVIIDKPQRPE